MYCPKCKKRYPVGVTFCSSCGVPLKEEPKGKKKGSFGRGLVVGLLVMALILGITGTVLYFACRPAGQTEAGPEISSPAGQNEVGPEISSPAGQDEVGPEISDSAGNSSGSYGSPEAAVEAFFRAAREENLDALVSTFGLEQQVDHLDLPGILRASHTVNAYSFSDLPPFPNDNVLARKLNIMAMRSEITENLHYSYVYHVYPQWVSTGPSKNMHIPCESGEEFLEKLELEDLPGLLSDIRFTGLHSLEELTDKNPKVAESWSVFRDQLQVYYPGNEDISYFLAEFTIGGDTWYQELAMINFDGNWYLCRLDKILFHSPHASQGLCAKEYLEEAIQSIKSR